MLPSLFDLMMRQQAQGDSLFGQANAPRVGATVLPQGGTATAALPDPNIQADQLYSMLYGSDRFQRDRQQNMLLGAASGLLKASGPTTIPTSIFSGLGAGIEGAMKGADDTETKQGQRLMLGAQFDTNRMNNEMRKRFMEIMTGGGTQTPGAGAPPGGATAPPGRATVADAPNAFLAQVAGEESGGQTSIPNSAGSGAAGLYQFMPQTWAAARAAIPGLPETVAGATREQQHAAALWLQQQNATQLARTLGRAPTPADERLAWHFGAGGAAKLLTMPPNTPFEQVPDGVMGAPTATVIAQNPHLRGQTIGSLYGQYQARFGGGVPTAAPPAAPRPTQLAAMPDNGSTVAAMPRTITTEQERAMLRPGETYVGPDGKVRVAQ